MFDNCVSLTVGSVLNVLAWLAALVMLVGGSALGVPWIAWAGLGTSAAAASLTVLQDNAKTRQVVRAVYRENMHHMRSL